MHGDVRTLAPWTPVHSLHAFDVALMLFLYALFVKLMSLSS